MSVLTLQDVDFAYDDVDVLRSVWLEVGRGESLALLGPNGVGKTTLTKLAVGLLRPSRGRVRIADESTLHPSTSTPHPVNVAHLVGYVFQHPDHQLFARTVFEEVAFGPTQLGFPHDDIEESVDGALRSLDLVKVKDQHPYDLPLPMRKLVTIAAAIAHRPKLLILDEPAQGMSRRHVDLVIGAVLRLKDQGLSAMVVTHDLDFAVEVCERAVVLRNGGVAFDGQMTDLVKDGTQLEQWNLVRPMASQISLALSLRGSPFRVSDVAMRIAQRVSRA